jgi:diguanylate cyclase (GGDEF)-like protein
LNAAVARATGEGKPLSLLMFDIDHFKSFNDSYGHLTGDQVLRLVAMSLKQTIKGQDITARYGGEEFAVGAAKHRVETGIGGRGPYSSRRDSQGIEEKIDW